MRKFILGAISLLINIACLGQMDVPGDGGNLKASVSEDIGITNITIRYSRPAVKGREGKIWGSVVPFGFNVFNLSTGKGTSPWRAGANEATVITFEHDVKVEGKEVKAGEYALFMAVGLDTTIVILSKQREAWGTFFYDPTQDVVRVKAVPVKLQAGVERLKYEFLNQTDSSCFVALQWERLMIPFKIEVDVDNIILNRMREQLIGPKGFISGNLTQAARYFIARNKNLEEVSQWARKAVTGVPASQTHYDNYRTYAQVLEKLNRMREADSVMGIALNTTAGLNHFVSYSRGLIAQKRGDAAVRVLMQAGGKFGDIYAINNAMSYSYSAIGNYKEAKRYAEKALKQATSETAKAAVSANIEKLALGRDIN